MSQKQDKHFRRTVRKVLAPEWEAFLKELESYGFWSKWSIAWAILTARKTRQEHKADRKEARRLKKQMKQRKPYKKLRKHGQ